MGVGRCYLCVCSTGSVQVCIQRFQHAHGVLSSLALMTHPRCICPKLCTHVHTWASTAGNDWVHLMHGVFKGPVMTHSLPASSHVYEFNKWAVICRLLTPLFPAVSIVRDQWESCVAEWIIMVLMKYALRYDWNMLVWMAFQNITTGVTSKVPIITVIEKASCELMPECGS